MAIKQFSLEPVLRYRKRQEDIAQQKFAKALQEEQKKREVLNLLISEKSMCCSELAAKETRGILAIELARYEERIAYLDREILQAEHALKKQQGIVHQRRNFLLKKSKDYKALETLKENQNRQWNEYQEKKEAAMLDEIAVLHFDKNRSDRT